MGISKLLKVWLLRFFMQEDASSIVLFEVGWSSLRCVAKFSKKEKWFTNLVCDEIKVETNFHEVTGLYDGLLTILFWSLLLKCRNAPKVCSFRFWTYFIFDPNFLNVMELSHRRLLN